MLLQELNEKYPSYIDEKQTHAAKGDAIEELSVKRARIKIYGLKVSNESLKRNTVSKI